MNYVLGKMYRGGVVIPKTIREQLTLKDGEFIKITIVENGKLQLEKNDIKQ